MNEDIQFRIHRGWEDVSGVVVSLLDKCEQGFAFEHPADTKVNRTHVHGYMFKPSLERKTVSQDWIKKKLSLKGNEDFYTSCKKGHFEESLDMSGAYCYGSKWDTIAVSCLKNISPVLLEELKQYARSMRPREYNIVTSFTPQTPVDKNTSTKLTQYQHVNACVLSLMDQHPQVVRMTLDDSKELIFNHVFAYFRAQKLYMGKYKQLDFFDMVLTTLDNREYKDSLFADFCKRNNFVKYNNGSHSSSCSS